jgi:hypothetical protein
MSAARRLVSRLLFSRVRLIYQAFDSQQPTRAIRSWARWGTLARRRVSPASTTKFKFKEKRREKLS